MYGSFIFFFNFGAIDCNNQLYCSPKRTEDKEGKLRIGQKGHCRYVACVARAEGRKRVTQSDGCVL